MNFDFDKAWCAFCATELPKRSSNSMFCNNDCRLGYRRVQAWLNKLYPPFKPSYLGDSWIDLNPLGNGYIDHQHEEIDKATARHKIGFVKPEKVPLEQALV
jgi:hypothetical protein